MPRRLPEPHSCMHCERLFLNASPSSTSIDEKLDQWKRFASSEAVHTLEGTPGLREHLEGQLRFLDILCTVTWRQIQEYAAGGCLFFSYIEEKTVDNDITEPTDPFRVKKFSQLLYYRNSGGVSGLEHERRFLIGVEHTGPSKFRFRYLVYPHQAFHLIHFKRSASKFKSDDWVDIDPFQMMLEAGLRQQDQLPGIQSKINYEPGSDDSLTWLKQQCERVIKISLADAQNRARFVPTRLVSFDPPARESRVRVIETRGLQQEYSNPNINLAFAALSYCWGGEQKLKITVTSRETLTGGITFTSLPRTFQDAIIVASMTGLSYLWIDALCIIQDDIDDKERELASMAKVYQNASFTIIASRAASVEEGFLSSRLPFEDNCRIPFRLKVRHPPNSPHSQSETEEVNSYSSVVCFPTMDMITSGDEGLEPVDPVFTRAWCFQESALSPTIIEFGLLTTCIRQVSATAGKPVFESVRDGWHGNRRTSNLIVIHEVLEHAKNTGVSLFNIWGLVIQRYSPLALSLPEDRLPAISALAETFSPYFGGGNGNYFAGLWRDTLPQALLWVIGVAEPDRDGRPPSGARMHAPTWSWASVTSPVSHGLVPLVLSPGSPFRADLGVEILGYTPQLVLPKVVFGAVSRGELRVRGRLRPVKLCLKDPYYLPYNHSLTMDESLMDGVSFPEHREHSTRAYTGDGNLSDKRGLHRIEYDHPQKVYRDEILCAYTHLDRREDDVGAIIAESEGLYLLPIVSGPSENRELHVDEACWNFRMPELRSIFGLVLVKNADGTYSRTGVFQFSNRLSGQILDSQALDLGECGALYEDQHKWIQGGELVEINLI